MGIHFNAFISYRHHPDDIRVAAQIHRSLEHFKVPKAIRKRCGDITRCFRDKEELPITSDLSDDIEVALKNSDYLIVICSVHTKESVWVQREIEMFLKSHDRSKILTVLCSGEPYDVIPDILLYNEQTDPITGEVKRIPREPLSCDWRLPRRKAHTEELPRLAAALLGCSYDELRQRRKQYRTRRLITAICVALGVALCLAAYFLYTTLTIRDANIRIQENLDEALKNQSLHLATAADERLAEGDRLTAISLAMAALPSQENPRPYVAEAEQVLTEALRVYETDSKEVAVGAMDIGANAAVEQFWLTESGDRVYMYDQRGILSAWDTDTIQKTGQVQLEDSNLKKLLINAQGYAVVLDGYNQCLYCFTPEGSCLWQKENCLDAAILSDGRTLLAITSENCMVFLDTSNGKQTRSPLTLSSSREDVGCFSFILDTYRDDRLIPLSYNTIEATDLLSVDSESGKKTVLASGIRRIACAYQSTTGKLLLMSSDGSGIMAGNYAGNRVTQTGRYEIFCYDLALGVREWESEMTVCTYTGFHFLEEIPKSNQLLCQSGNVFQILNMQNGEILSRCETGSSVIAVDVGETTATAVLQDGFFAKYDYESNMCYELKRAQGNLAQAHIGNAYFILPQYSSHVTVYRALKGEPLWTWSTTENNYINIKTQRVYGDLLAFSDNYHVTLFNIKQQQLCWQTKLSSELLGFTTDGAELWMAKSEDLTVFDVASGTSVSWELPLDPENEFSWLVGSAYMAQNRLYYPVNSNGTLKLLCWAPKDTAPTVVTVLDMDTTENSTIVDATVVACHGDYVWIYLDSGQLYEVNVASGTVQTITEELSQQPDFAFRDEDDLFAFTVGNEIWTCYPGGELRCQIALTDVKAGALCFYGEELLALCDDGTVYRFSAAGDLLSRTAIGVYNTFNQDLFSDNGQIGWYFTEDDKLIVNACSIGNVIDCDSWKCCTVILKFVRYRHEDNSLICTTDQGMVAYPRHTVDKLLDIGKDQLNGYEMTTEQRISYGID